MSALDVYIKFNPQLVNSLPMKDALFTSRLAQKNLFAGNIKAVVKAKLTEADAAEYFLDNVIERPLKNEDSDTEPFEKLLLVMEQFDDQPLRKLARNIREKLGGGINDTEGRLSGKYLIVCVHIRQIASTNVTTIM